MDTLLVKIFATALTLSQVTTAPDALKTQFDRTADQKRVVTLLRDGCAHMRKVFEIEDINLDDLLATAMEDPDLTAGGTAAFRGIKFADLQNAYRQFCTNEATPKWDFDAGAVIDFYNKTLADLPDPARLQGLKLPGATVMLDRKGARFKEVFDADQRRISVPLGEVPLYVQRAFVAAEDKRFYEHAGIDERGLIRAAVANMGQPGRPQGASTITQQVVKNLLVGDDVSYERKIREMIVASRVETTLSKSEILELYLNSAYLGRGAWGVEMAARSYFGKSAQDLTVAEGAMLAGLLKGPSFFNPDRHPDRAKERLAYVLGRMQEDGVISADDKNRALATPPKLQAFEQRRRDSGLHFVDFLSREAKSDGVTSLTAEPYTVHSTINAALQREAESSLQEGLARFEMSSGRVSFRGPEANLGDAIQKLSSGTGAAAAGGLPPWQRALQAARLPLVDVHWEPAVILDKGGGKRGDGNLRVGIRDGRVIPLNAANAGAKRNLGLYDVVLVRVIETKTVTKTKGQGGAQVAVAAGNARAELRVRPTVQGAALVLENKSGRILAMAGSFSYFLSQLNRTSQTARQPGSAMKPLTYLTALQAGLQPNTLVSDDPITLAPVGDRNGIIAREYNSQRREEYYWSPRNADGSIGGMFTLRRGLENSVNVVTAHLLEGGISADPEKSLDQVCATAVAAKIYAECVRYYPFVLGAQPARMIDLAAFYAAVANEGALPKPHAIESIEADGHTIFQYPNAPLPQISAADRTSFYQLKTILQGVVARGTARAIGGLSAYVAGKTGTTEDAVDGWFIGFTNDVTIAVWVGYDNGDGKRRSLGTTATGARVALPIFEPILQAVWAQSIAPKAPLNGPSAEAKRYLVDLPIDYYSGTRVGAAPNGYGQYNQYGQYVQQYGGNAGQGFVEHFRVGPDGKFVETQYQLMATAHSEGDPAMGSPDPGGGGEQSWGAWGWGSGNRRGAQQDYYQQQQQQQQQQGYYQQRPRGFVAPWDNWGDRRQWDGGRGSWSGWPF